MFKIRQWDVGKSKEGLTNTFVYETNICREYFTKMKTDKDFSALTKKLQALNNNLYSQIINFSGIDEKGMKLEYYNNTYINVEDMDSLQNKVLYITGLPASGKSELAEKLSKEYEIPVIGLDELANNDFDFSNKTIQKYFEASQSSKYEAYSGNEAENFLHWLKTAKNTAKVIVEGYQIYDIQFKTSGKFYNSMLKNNKISMTIVNPRLQTVIQNRITRDSVDQAFASQQTNTEFQKLKKAFPNLIKTTENLCL